jgi:hypothetical protein
MVPGMVSTGMVSAAVGVVLGVADSEELLHAVSVSAVTTVSAPMRARFPLFIVFSLVVVTYYGHRHFDSSDALHFYLFPAATWH